MAHLDLQESSGRRSLFHLTIYVLLSVRAKPRCLGSHLGARDIILKRREKGITKAISSHDRVY